jgi:hypothetical protein
LGPGLLILSATLIARLLLHDLRGLAKLVRRYLRIRNHVTVPLENATRVDDQKRCVNVAAEAAGRLNFSPAGYFDIPKNLAVNFNLTHPDVRMNNGIAAYNQSLTAVDRAVKITVDSDET